MPYVYSTTSCSGTFVDYGPPNKHAGHAIAIHKVTIKGGHGVTSSRKETDRRWRIYANGGCLRK